MDVPVKSFKIFKTFFLQKKTVHGGWRIYYFFQMIYPWSFRFFTPWRRVLPLDKHQIDPWTQKLTPGHCKFTPGHCKFTPWTWQFSRVFPVPLDNTSSTPVNGFFLDEPIGRSRQKNDNTELKMIYKKDSKKLTLLFQVLVII